MKTGTKLLFAPVVVLGFVREAGAEGRFMERHEYVVKMQNQLVGFADGVYDDEHGLQPLSVMYLGPLGFYEVPFTATQGLVGSVVFVVGLIALLVVATMRWKRKQPSRL